MPNTSIRKVARLVIGLMIILAIVEPLVGVIANPGWIDSIFADVLAVNSESFLHVGDEMAKSAEAQAQVVWARGMENDIALVLTLIEGIDDAAVALVNRGPPEDEWRVEVTLWRRHGVSEAPEWRAQKEGEVGRLVRRLLHPLSVDAVEVTWEDVAQHL